MSRYYISYRHSVDGEPSEYYVMENDRAVFTSACREETECMLEEFRICEQGEEINQYLNQLSEFDYV